MALPQNVKDSLARLQDIATGSNGTNGDSPESVLQVVNTARSMSLKDYQTLARAGFDGATNRLVDDKTYLMEHIIRAVTDLPTESILSNTLTNQFLGQLWSDLQHPPQSYMGKEYAYRKADGSNNNFLWPQIGKAGQPYARSVKQRRMQPVARPDPAVIFDSLLARKKWEPHPNKISSVLFYVATVIIHDCFHTSHLDFNISETSSYLDLAPLYGSCEKEQMMMRTMKDGKLKPDCFSDARILGFPPGVGLLLIFFNRFHNNVVEQLAQIDEGGRFSRVKKPRIPLQDYDGEKEYDEALFQTARLVTCGLYINIVLQDYVRTILNLNRVNTKWNLDPRSEQGKALFGEKIPVASGNQVAAEFNLVYRWHSTVSKRDEKWTEQLTKEIFPEIAQNPDASTEEFLSALQGWARKINPDPLERPFEGLHRDAATQRFSDDDLAQIWTESVEDIAGSFGANHVPEVLKIVEILGIEQARSWNLATLNEFRTYFKLQPHETFESINPDKAVQEQLKRLYETPDNVELYPGIVVEAAKESMKPGSGLCTNFTISRAILSDAVALVRGDRFYTVDYTPNNLTNWGFDAASYDIEVDGGGVLYKLVLNALPRNYTYNSVYVHFPLTIPTENRSILKELKKDHLYDFSRPIPKPAIRRITSFNACKSLFQIAATDATPPMFTLKPPTSEQRVDRKNKVHDSHILVAFHNYLSTTPNSKYIVRFFTNATSSLLQRHSYKIAGTSEVDVIRHVVNLAQVHFAACMFALPLRTSSNPDGAFTAEELWSILTAISTSIHAINEPVNAFRARLDAESAVESVGRIVLENVKSAYSEERGWIERAAALLYRQHNGDLTDMSTHLIQTLMKNGITPEDLTYNYLLPVAATVVVSQARAFADFLTYILPLNGQGSGLLDIAQKLAVMETDGADAQIEHIILESLRMNSKTSVYVTPTKSMSFTAGGDDLNVAAGETVLCDLYTAHRDTTAFPEADQYDSDHTSKKHLPGLPSLPPAFPGRELGRPALVGMFKAIMRLPNLRRARGQVGQMKMIKSGNGSQVYLTQNESKAFSYPSSMKVNFGK